MILKLFIPPFIYVEYNISSVYLEAPHLGRNYFYK